MIAQMYQEYLAFRRLRAVPRLLSYLLYEGRPLTTRGRWINPLVFAWLRCARWLPWRQAVERPVFVIGTGRSGTTILGVLLSLHREIGFLNEPKALWHRIFPGEDLIGSYSEGAAAYCLTAADTTPAMRTRAHALYGSYLRLTGARRVVDKYPELVFRTGFVRALFDDAQFIFLARDGWDMCHSVAAWSRRHRREHAGEVEDWWGRDGRKWHLLIDQVATQDPDLAPHVEALRELQGDVDRAAVEWVLSMRRGLAESEAEPRQVLRIDYETLTAAPRETLARLLQFCSVSADEALGEHAASVLRQQPPRPAVALHPLILPAFEATMRQLGYRMDA